MSDLLSLTERDGWGHWQVRVMDIVRTVAAYLGVAVIVSIVTIVSVPSLRGQAKVLHQAVLSALVPDHYAVNPSSAIDPTAVAPQVNPVDLDGIPARRLARLKPPVPPDLDDPIQLSEPIGLLGNNRIDRIEAAKRHFGISPAQRDALESYVARKYWVGKAVVNRLIETVLLNAKEFDVNPVLILAVMSVESRFNPYAESGAGAQGLMQVMTRVHSDKFEALGQEDDAAFHPQHNVKVGVQILSDCIKRRGSVADGLKCYVGATGPDDGGYSEKVIAEQRRMALAAKIALPR